MNLSLWNFQTYLNKIGKGVLHNVVHKIANGILLSFLSLFKNINNYMWIGETPIQNFKG
jgi:hypothetical protein